MKRKLVSMLLALSMILSLLPVQAFAAGTGRAADTANPFKDVARGSWYYDAVQYVRVNGLFLGTSETTFTPEGTMTRGMFVTVLGLLAGNDGNFMPNGNATRAQAAMICYRTDEAVDTWYSEPGAVSGRVRLNPRRQLVRQVLRRLPPDQEL